MAPILNFQNILPANFHIHIMPIPSSKNFSPEQLARKEHYFISQLSNQN